MKFITLVGSALLGFASAASNTTTRNSTYDYIVAGAGASGLVVAEKLAAAGHKVLLVERGGPSYYSTGNRDDLMKWNKTVTAYDVPGMAYYTDISPTIQWCTDIAASAGCLLGGSTMLNALMFIKPRAADFEAWPKGWQWEDGVSEVAKSVFERMPGSILPSADGKRYDDGAFEVMSKFLENNGWDEVNALDNVEAKDKIFTHPPWLISNGLRGGPVRDILPDAEALDNFSLQLHAKVLRVVRKGPIITGVEVEHEDSSREIIKLSKGGSVILSSGTHSTPRILFNSGIGPKDQIRIVESGSTKIELPPASQWIDLPVGQRLRDHPIVVVDFQTKDKLPALPSTAFTDPNDETVELFAEGSGLLSQSAQRLNFWKSVEGSDGITRYVQGTVNAPENNTISAKVYLTHGLTSYGTLEITPDGNTNITQKPFLNTKGDRDALKTFIGELLSYARKPDSNLSVPSNVTADSIMEVSYSGNHHLGSAHMGTKNDGKSVVGPDTRVWGTKNLFVVDGSMHPEVPTGNTQAFIMVAAAHAANKILDVTSGRH
ncbi:cellobiose dehydrogenase [Fusarium sporotrichioides]|uniref:Cellobiose dehydrogenase n=1 Tax=Fusarium sporotrichioides TaxID=5514 RepID=A0A395SUP4_FUSSP|nr:cellobiose dehydrogenase [Fusarium sporotrichioides]